MNMDIEKKLLILGPPNCGKSSIILTTFGYVEPEVILHTPMEPTRGIDVSNYEWRNLSIGVFDLAGQEIDNWLTKENEYLFPATDEIIVVFDISKTSKKEIMQLLKPLYILIKRYDIPFVFVLLHKVDLLKSTKSREKHIKKIRTEINKFFGEDVIRVFSSSILPDFFKGFQFTINWILSSLELSLTSSRVQHGSELVAMKLLPTDRIDVSLEEEALADIPKPKGQKKDVKIGFEEENFEEELQPEDNERIWQD
jgi:GTPase SAR1 family protein